MNRIKTVLTSALIGLAISSAHLTKLVEAAVFEGDREKRKQMYLDIQIQFRETSPFAIMFQQIEQSALRESVENWSTGQAVTSAAYWQVTK